MTTREIELRVADFMDWRRNYVVPRVADMFRHVPKSSGTAWDGHTTKEKYERIEEVCARIERVDD